MRTLVLLLALVVPSVGAARTPKALCRSACSAIVALCVRANQDTALRTGVPSAKVARRAGKYRRQCRNGWVGRCRQQGVGACVVPTTTTSSTTTTTTRPPPTTTTTLAPTATLLGSIWDFSGTLFEDTCGLNPGLFRSSTLRITSVTGLQISGTLGTLGVSGDIKTATQFIMASPVTCESGCCTFGGINAYELTQRSGQAVVGIFASCTVLGDCQIGYGGTLVRR